MPVSEARIELAARMTKSKQEVPHYYLTVDIEVPKPCHMFFTNRAPRHLDECALIAMTQVDALLAARAKLNLVLPEKEQLTVNDLLVKAAALAMKTVPDVNARST